MMTTTEHRTSNVEHRTLKLERGEQFFIRWRGFAVRFHADPCRKVYSLVAPELATRFKSQVAAARACGEYRLKVGQIEIVNVD
jgi:hypothetical protein